MVNAVTGSGPSGEYIKYNAHCATPVIAKNLVIDSTNQSINNIYIYIYKLFI